MSDGVLLRDRRFSTRFLGRPWTWVWLASALAPGILSWVWAATTLRGFAGDERTWFLWSGNVVLALFVLTLGFVFRKWSVKLPYFRDWGRAPAQAGDACWAEIQVLNGKVRQGAYADDEQIRAAALAVLQRFHVDKAQRAEIRTLRSGQRDVKYVALVKREPFGRLEPWLEMHMGLGVAGCVGVWFHADGAIRSPMGWALLAGSAVVLVTGVVLAVLYRVLPQKLARVEIDIPYEEAGVAREAYDACIAGMLTTLADDVRNDLQPALALAPSPDERRKRNTQTTERMAIRHPDQRETVRDLLVMAGTRDHLVWSTEPARRIDFLLRVWRWVHVPASVFLFFVIALHVGLVLWY